MRKKEFSTRDVLRILKNNGFVLLRDTSSSHRIFSDGSRTISIPTSGKSVNKMMFARLIKEYDLKI